jgi:hypothetical protein
MIEKEGIHASIRKYRSIECANQHEELIEAARETEKLRDGRVQ